MTLQTLNSPSPDWRTALRIAVRDTATLYAAVGLSDPSPPLDPAVSTGFPTLVPWEYINRMERGNPQDPLFLQVVPRTEEIGSPADYRPDPVGDLSAIVHRSLLKKYAGRALLIVNGACAAHCRYCFRREFPYQEAGPRAWNEALAGIAADPSLQEVLLSGGDPWTLTDDQLAGLISRIAAIPHVQRLRVHTRLPILIPQRVTPRLVQVMTTSRLTPIVVVHTNHPRELCPDTTASLRHLVAAGIPTLNQTVLLKGINDDLEILTQLSEALINTRVIPYYLHQLDKVLGASQFEVPVERGLELMGGLRRRLPGYAVPRYVREIEGDASKRILA